MEAQDSMVQGLRGGSREDEGKGVRSDWEPRSKYRCSGGQVGAKKA